MSARSTPLVVAGVLAVACSEGGFTTIPTVDGGAGTDGGTIPDDIPALDVDGPSAVDPLFGEAVVDVHTRDPAQDVEVRITDADGGEVLALDVTTDADGDVSVPWDGRTADGDVVPGVYTLTATVTAEADAPDARDDVEIAVVRAGFTAAWLEGDDGLTGTREPLYWPLDGALRDAGDPVATLAAIDDGAVPIDFAPLPDATFAVRPAGNEPVAFVYDSRPILTLQVAEVTGERLPTGLDQARIRAVIDGWTALGGDILAPGASLVFQRDAALGDTVGVTTEDLALGFESDGVVFGTQVLPVRIYRLLDRSQFVGPEPKYRPWAPVVEQALPALEGTAPVVEDVVDALVVFVYRDLGLVYDTNAGASAYSEYGGWNFTDPHFLLTDFLTRRYGDVINCSDAGNILGAYANMVGARLDHLILSPSFDLNEIKAIGIDDYTSCPFGPFGCGFNYHAVTTVPASGAIWDATLALDGDADPGSSPSVELLVQTIDDAEYLDRLVRSGRPRYQNQAQETLQ